MPIYQLIYDSKTGSYWYPMYCYFIDIDPELFVIDPLLAHEGEILGGFVSSKSDHRLVRTKTSK